jgi:hypothetical protein
MKGSAPMMAAEAFASMDSAWTLAFMRLRSRSTLGKVAEGLRQVAARLRSGSGSRCRRRPLPGTAWCRSCAVPPRAWTCRFAGLRPCGGIRSARARGDSLAISRMPSLIGRPDLTARTMTSSALGSSFEEALIRRARLKPTNQRGRPNAAGERKAPGTTTSGAPRNRTNAAGHARKRPKTRRSGWSAESRLAHLDLQGGFFMFVSRDFCFASRSLSES